MVFKQYVEGVTGVEVYPHVMRHFSALLFLKHNPGQYEILSRILCHRDTKTTKTFYTGLETEFAWKLSEDVLLREREAAVKLLKSSWPKHLPEVKLRPRTARV